jgi:hypothetical protein
VDQTGRYLYSGEAQSGIQGYSINSSDGTLTSLGAVTPFPGTAGIITAGVLITPNNLVIATGTNSPASQASVFTIGGGGALTATTGSPFDICFAVIFGAIAAVPQ